MPSPAFEISELDKSMAEDGEDVILRRPVGSTAGSQQFIDVRCRAFVRAFQPNELVGTISQTDSLAIISPTQIINSGWPGGQPISSAQFQSDKRLPKINDKLVIQGRQRTVSFVKRILVGNTLVRIELTVAG